MSILEFTDTKRERWVPGGRGPPECPLCCVTLPFGDWGCWGGVEMGARQAVGSLPNAGFPSAGSAQSSSAVTRFRRAIGKTWVAPRGIVVSTR